MQDNTAHRRTFGYRGGDNDARTSGRLGGDVEQVQQDLLEDTEDEAGAKAYKARIWDEAVSSGEG
jgi:hypothetical protein